MYASLWHEVAHVLYSNDFPWLDGARLRYAANLVEDGRAERRLVQEHPALRTWLRRNAWSSYLGREDDELDETTVAQASAALVPHLRPHHLVEEL